MIIRMPFEDDKEHDFVEVIVQTSFGEILLVITNDNIEITNLDNENGETCVMPMEVLVEGR